jgi:hypothetical protein
MDYNKTNRRIFFLFLMMIALFTACKEEVKQKKIIHNTDSSYIKIVEKWVINTQKINGLARTYTQNWNEYGLLQNELSQKPLPTLGAIKQKGTSIAQKTEKLLTTIPAFFNNQDTRSRILVLLSKTKMLETQVKVDYLNPKKIALYTQEIEVAFGLLQKQMERQMAKSQIQFEEGELEMRQQIKTDTLSKK